LNLFTYPIWEIFLGFFGLFLTAYVYAKHRNETVKAAVDCENSKAAKSLADLEFENRETLSGGKGKAGEDALYLAVTSACNFMSLRFSTNRTMGFTDAVILPSGTDTYSKEIDLLLITDFGVFVFEAKHWSGILGFSESKSDTLTIHRRDGSYEDREDPMRKTQGKAMSLCEDIGENTNVYSLIVMTDSKGLVKASMPADYLHITEIEYFLRLCRDGKVGNIKPKYEKFDEIVNSIARKLDPSPDAKHNHMMRLSPTSDNIKTYQNNHQQILHYRKRIPLEYPKFWKLRYWVIGMLTSLGVTCYAAYTDYQKSHAQTIAASPEKEKAKDTTKAKTSSNKSKTKN
jgi:Nuclease-related domain